MLQGVTWEARHCCFQPQHMHPHPSSSLQAAACTPLHPASVPCKPCHQHTHSQLPAVGHSLHSSPLGAPPPPGLCFFQSPTTVTLETTCMHMSSTQRAESCTPLPQPTLCSPQGAPPLDKADVPTPSLSTAPPSDRLAQGQQSMGKGLQQGQGQQGQWQDLQRRCQAVLSAAAAEANTDNSSSGARSGVDTAAGLEPGVTASAAAAGPGAAGVASRSSSVAGSNAASSAPPAPPTSSAQSSNSDVVAAAGARGASAAAVGAAAVPANTTGAAASAVGAPAAAASSGAGSASLSRGASSWLAALRNSSAALTGRSSGGAARGAPPKS